MTNYVIPGIVPVGVYIIYWRNNGHTVLMRSTFFWALWLPESVVQCQILSIDPGKVAFQFCISQTDPYSLNLVVLLFVLKSHSGQMNLISCVWNNRQMTHALVAHLLSLFPRCSVIGEEVAPQVMLNPTRWAPWALKVGCVAESPKEWQFFRIVHGIGWTFNDLTPECGKEVDTPPYQNKNQNYNQTNNPTQSLDAFIVKLESWMLLDEWISSSYFSYCYVFLFFSLNIFTKDTKEMLKYRKIRG